MALDLDKLNEGLGPLYNIKSGNAPEWSFLIGETIADYLSDIIPVLKGTLTNSSGGTGKDPHST